MFQNFFLNSFLRGFAKTSNIKSFYINNSMLYNKNLNKTNLNKTNLNKTNLNKTNLNKTNLNKTNLNKTNLNKTNLNKTNKITNILLLKKKRIEFHESHSRCGRVINPFNFKE